MKEYLGIKYEKKLDGWHLTWPSGYKSVCNIETEEELKKEIASLKQKLGI